MALRNSWIIYKHENLQFQHKSQNVHTASERRTKVATANKRLQIESNAAAADYASTPEMRKTCSGKDCRNRTTDICVICKKTEWQMSD